MRRLLNAMAREAMMAGDSRAAPRIGIVSAYDPDAYCAKVQIQPEGTETGWLPILSPWIGNGWGLFCPPTIGDQVEVQFQEDSFEAGFICLRFFSDEQRPLAVNSGEFWLVHQSGTFVKLTNDTKMLINAVGDLDVTVGGNVNLTVNGNVTSTISGTLDVTANGHAHITTHADAAITANSGVTIDGAGGAGAMGIVQGNCACAFTGAPHPQISATVKGSF